MLVSPRHRPHDMLPISHTPLIFCFQRRQQQQLASCIMMGEASIQIKLCTTHMLLSCQTRGGASDDTDGKMVTGVYYFLLSFELIISISAPVEIFLPLRETFSRLCGWVVDDFRSVVLLAMVWVGFPLEILYYQILNLSNSMPNLVVGPFLQYVVEFASSWARIYILVVLVYSCVLWWDQCT